MTRRAAAGDVTVVVTAQAGEPAVACLSAPGLRELGDRVPVVVVGDAVAAAAVAAAAAAGARYVPAGRPGRAVARNIGLATAGTRLVAFVDGQCRPQAGWLDGMLDGLGSHAAAWGLTRGGGVRARLVPSGAWVWPAGAGIFDRQLLQEVGAFSPLLRHWDDLYIGARLHGYGQTVGQAADAVVDARPGPACRLGYWLAELRQHDDLRGRPVETAAPRPGTRAAMALGMLAHASRPPRKPARRLPVRSRIDGQAVCLTIDDGPSPNTPALLRILARHGARADFFLIGSQVRDNPGLAAGIVADGHAVHNHSFSHRQADALSRADIIGEFRDTAALLLREVSEAERPRLRLPFGAGADDPYVHDAIARWRPDCELVQWSIDTWDYKCWPRCHRMADVERQAAAQAERVLCAPDLAGSIILMHDSAYGGGLPLADAFARVLLDRLLAGLAQRNLATVLLDEAGG